MTNHTDDPILTAKFGTRIRWTVNPPHRRSGGHVWDAGPAADWCEVAAEGALDGLRARLGAVGVPTGLGRLERQAWAHSRGYCDRPGDHWPDTARLGDSRATVTPSAVAEMPPRYAARNNTRWQNRAALASQQRGLDQRIEGTS